jgi:hypothetical protein
MGLTLKNSLIYTNYLLVPISEQIRGGPILKMVKLPRI